MCALLHANSRCAICAGAMDLKQPLFATSGVFFPREDPLWRFCDTPMHWECYAPWKDRPRFARAYFQMWVEGDSTNPHWAKAYLDENYYISVNPQPPVEEVHLHLAEWGEREFVKLKDWESWRAAEADWMKDLHPWLQNSWRPLLVILRERMPTAESLLRNVDWVARRRQLDELQHRDQIAQKVVDQKKAEAARLLAAYNHQAALLSERMRTIGILCPGCNRRGSDFKVVDGGTRRKSYLVCIGCGKSVWPDDLPQS